MNNSSGKFPEYANSTSQHCVVFYLSSILKQNLKLRSEVFKGPEAKASPPNQTESTLIKKDFTKWQQIQT